MCLNKKQKKKQKNKMVEVAAKVNKLKQIFTLLCFFSLLLLLFLFLLFQFSIRYNLNMIICS